MKPKDDEEEDRFDDVGCERCGKPANCEHNDEILCGDCHCEAEENPEGFYGNGRERAMRIRLTDGQIVLLEWDRRPFLRKLARGREYEVTAADLDMMRDVSETMLSEADPRNRAYARTLLRKLDSLAGGDA